MPQVHHHAAVRAHSMGDFKDREARISGHQEENLMIHQFVFAISMIAIMYIMRLLPMALFVAGVWVWKGVSKLMVFMGVLA